MSQYTQPGHLGAVKVNHSMYLPKNLNFGPSATFRARSRKSDRGFSLVELLVVVFATVLITAMAVTSIPTVSRNFRLGGDTRSISAQINLARMRAASGFTHARVYLKLDTNTYRLETWNKAGACWQTDGDTNSCTQTTSPVTALGWGNSFGFGSISAGPTAATNTIAQAATCRSGVAGASPGTATSSTACIEFNSRGYPVDSTNAIIASDAFYLGSNSTTYYAIAVSISGQPTAYRYSGSAWVQY